MKLTSTTLVNDQVTVKNDTKINSLYMRSVNDLSEQNIIKELMIQSNNIGQINMDNLSGYLSPRDMQRVLSQVKENINELVHLLVEKKRNNEASNQEVIGSGQSDLVVLKK
jgi:hypothetical protein